MKCSRCSLELPRGSAHVSAEGCVEALQEALEKATACKACGDPVPTVIHTGCVPAELINRGAKLGSGVLERRLTEFLSEKLSGTKRPPEDPTGEGDGPTRKRWTP